MSATVEPMHHLRATPVARARVSDTTISTVRLLDEDPDLAAALPAERLPDARARLVVRVVQRKTGAWSSLESHQAALGLLVLDGVLVREILMEDAVSAELLGTGDLLRPRASDSPSRLLRSTVRWIVLEPARIAVLDGPCVAAVTAYHGIQAALLDRVAERADRLATTQAICQLNGVDRRVLSLLWHLAERWGRVAPGGVVVPLRLPHRILASLVGARRPTVTTALARLAADGSVERRADGTWLLRGEPVGLPTEAASRFVALRRPGGSVAD